MKTLVEQYCWYLMVEVKMGNVEVDSFSQAIELDHYMEKSNLIFKKISSVTNWVIFRSRVAVSSQLRRGCEREDNLTLFNFGNEL